MLPHVSHTVREQVTPVPLICNQEADTPLFSNCPLCSEPLVFPRDLLPYCEEYGWPDEDFDKPDLSPIPRVIPRP
jgi:hypothetical protein